MKEVFIVIEGNDSCGDYRNIIAVCSTKEKAVDLAKLVGLTEADVYREEVDIPYTKFYYYECWITDGVDREIPHIDYHDLDAEAVLAPRKIRNREEEEYTHPYYIDWRFHNDAGRTFGFIDKGTTKEEALENTMKFRAKCYSDLDAGKKMEGEL